MRLGQASWNATKEDVSVGRNRRSPDKKGPLMHVFEGTELCQTARVANSNCNSFKLVINHWNNAQGVRALTRVASRE